MEREKSWLLLVTAGIWALVSIGYAWRAVQHAGARTLPVTLCVLCLTTAGFTVARWWMERKRAAKQDRPQWLRTCCAMGCKCFLSG